MAHIREIKFRYVPKFSITKNIRFSNQKKIANNLVKYLKKLKYLKINNWVVKPTSSGKTGKSYQKERIKKKAVSERDREAASPLGLHRP